MTDERIILSSLEHELLPITTSRAILEGMPASFSFPKPRRSRSDALRRALAPLSIRLEQRADVVGIPGAGT